jgi:hypothetical protein
MLEGLSGQAATADELRSKLIDEWRRRAVENCGEGDTDAAVDARRLAEQMQAEDDLPFLILRPSDSLFAGFGKRK